ncbi:hypothetical protein ACFFHM_09805 [Halalkalibacter kiskunsagensis]|uniref:YjcQ protein n=1 Tax=Halalkalibacter kiskunsagensis TaxID=1548599 RepID=A0ABV6KCU1_9BACI
MLNKEEEELVFDFIYLPLVRRVLLQDIEKVKNSNVKFTEPYILFLEKIINNVGMDLGKVKKTMFKQGIIVYDQGIIEQRCNYLIVCRGYRKEMNLFPHLMKNDVMEYIKKYFLDI